MTAFGLVVGDHARMPTPPMITQRCERSDWSSCNEAVAKESPLGQIKTTPERALDASAEDVNASSQRPLESVESLLSSRRLNARRHVVWLHVYDLDAITARLNELFLKSLNIGAFHCGVEVLGYEWFASYGLSSNSGVVRHGPKGHAVHIYRESVYMGESPLSVDEIEAALCDAMDNWPQNSYHPVSRNCLTFAEELTAALKVPEPFPAWIRGISDVAKSKVVFPVADATWEWIKWYHSRPSSETTAPSDGGTDAGRLFSSSSSEDSGYAAAAARMEGLMLMLGDPSAPSSSEHSGNHQGVPSWMTSEAPVLICKGSAPSVSSRIQPLSVEEITERWDSPHLMSL